MNIDKRTLILFIAALAIVVGLQLFIQKSQDKDVLFCRNFYAQLVKGSPAAANSIDWENFQALGYDVGAEYKLIAHPKEKLDYRAWFIKGFSIGFTQFKGKLNAFTNWRIYDRSDQKVVVACDYPRYNQTLIFTFSKAGAKRKLIAIDWRK